MKVSLSTWHQFKKSYGDHIARQKLGWETKRVKSEYGLRMMRTRRDLLAVAMELVHDVRLWPDGNPIKNRKRYSHVIRTLIERSRNQRLTILGYCAPGVSRQLLP